MELYLFFRPDQDKAQYYLGLTKRRKNKGKFRQITTHLNAILNLSTNDFSSYDIYTFYAIHYKAYSFIVPFLEKLKHRYPNEPKFVGRLGRTLANDVINKPKQAIAYLRQAIDLYEKSSRREQVADHTVYYLQALLKLGNTDLIETELEKHHSALVNNSKYHLFLANFYAFLRRPVPELVNQFDKAIQNARTKQEYKTAIKMYIDFLRKQTTYDHSQLIISLTRKLRQL